MWVGEGVSEWVWRPRNLHYVKNKHTTIFRSIAPVCSAFTWLIAHAVFQNLLLEIIFFFLLNSHFWWEIFFSELIKWVYWPQRQIWRRTENKNVVRTFAQTIVCVNKLTCGGAFWKICHGEGVLVCVVGSSRKLLEHWRTTSRFKRVCNGYLALSVG
jgi:hypothetical protein